jgi:hypothetical protein
MLTHRPLTDDEGEVFDLAGDDENPEWAEEDFAKAVPFSGLPLEMQKLLSGERNVKPDADASSTREPAA